ncbi:hypothetical protein [Xanthomonas sp. NCPPB 2632]|jgi:hypothetical protein|uniref:hypothetical protein n=1 Tax=Xanthomonas sp. NCPPB 2632 TaxID=3240912 RepID=UPI003514EBE5
MGFINPRRARGGKSVNNTQSTLVEDFDTLAAGTWIVPDHPVITGWLTIEAVEGHAVVTPITERDGNQLTMVQAGGNADPFCGLSFTSRRASAVILDVFSPAAGQLYIQLYDHLVDNPEDATFSEKWISLTKGRNLIQESHPEGLRIEAVALSPDYMDILVVDNLTLVGV